MRSSIQKLAGNRHLWSSFLIGSVDFFVSFVIGHSNDFGFVFTREFYGTNEKHSICNYDHTGILLVRPDYNGF